MLIITLTYFHFADELRLTPVPSGQPSTSKKSSKKQRSQSSSKSSRSSRSLFISSKSSRSSRSSKSSKSSRSSKSSATSCGSPDIRNSPADYLQPNTIAKVEWFFNRFDVTIYAMSLNFLTGMNYLIGPNNAGLRYGALIPAPQRPVTKIMPN